MKDAATLRADAWDAIVKGLGMADALRYRILFESGTGDYAAEREVLFAGMNIDDWVKAARRIRPARPGTRRRR
jgi:hypothetical protein